MPFEKGKSGNRKGRPRLSVAEKFRKNPKSMEVMEKIVDVANTLGEGESEHPQAVSCAKIIADKVIPTLKAQDVKLDADLGIDMPKIVLKLKD
jgi:hypothetical protein